MTSNAHRAYESAAGKSDIKDEYNEVVLKCEAFFFMCELRCWAGDQPWRSSHSNRFI